MLAAALSESRSAIFPSPYHGETRVHDRAFVKRAFPTGGQMVIGNSRREPVRRKWRNIGQGWKLTTHAESIRHIICSLGSRAYAGIPKVNLMQSPLKLIGRLRYWLTGILGLRE